jgi:UDP-4-amino-4,6-dideoxy-N-acetyl-beta-L-altrosamine transaminase
MLKIPYGRQSISDFDVDAVVKVLRSEFLTQGPVIPLFESAIAGYCGARFSCAVNSATSALHIACLALGLGPGDIVWTSPNTFVASANCALYCGADVDFVDIDALSYNMCVKKLEEKLKEAKNNNKLPKIVIPVHYAGQTCDMKRIHDLSKIYNFKIIEDASHAIGGKYKSACFPEDGEGSSSCFKAVGGCQFSDITVFSFHPVKIITTGEGGVAVTNSEILIERLRRLRSHGITSDQNLMDQRPLNEIWNYQQIELGFNYRMTEMQAALGMSQLSRLDLFVQERHKIAEQYNNELGDLPIFLPWQDSFAYSSYHLYPIRLNLKLISKSQRQIYDELIQNDVIVNLHYIPVYRQPYYERMGFKRGYCPEAEKFHEEALSLPIFPGLGVENQDRVIRLMRELIV